MMPEITRKVGVPRSLAVPFGLGTPFGPPGERAEHRQVLAALIELCRRDDVPVFDIYDTTRR